MKLARIGVIMALLLAIGGLSNGAAAAPQQEPAAKAGPQKVVWDYYAAYIAYQQYQFKKDDKTVKPVPDRSLDPSLVTQHFIDSYRKMMQEDEKTKGSGEIGYLDYNPIICGQDFPDTMAGTPVELVKKTKTEATVKVTPAGFTPPAPPFIVKLKKQPAGWRIDAILCDGKDFEALYRDMKKEEKQQKK